MTLTAVDGRLAISYQTRDAIGWRWHHIELAIIERWAQEQGIQIPQLEPARTSQR